MSEAKSFIVRNKAIRGNAVVAVQEIQEEPIMEVIIKPYRKSKSQEQLGYLWAGVLPSISRHIEESGGKHFSADDIYDWMLDEYGEKHIVSIKGVDKVAVKSASKMNTKEMSDFIEKIIQFAAVELSFAVPPSEYR